MAMSANAQNPLDTYTVDPENNSTLTYAMDIDITWDGVTDLVLKEPTGAIEVSFDGTDLDASGVEYYLYAKTDSEPGMDEDTGNVIGYYLSISWQSLAYNEDYSTRAGEYTITVPAGLVADEAGTNSSPEIVLNYVLKGYAGNTTIMPKPEYGKVYNPSALDNVTVSWVGYYEFESVNGGDITYTNNDNSGTLDADLVTVNENNGTIILDLSGFEEGSLSVEIPSGYVVFNEYVVSGSVTIDYTLFNGLSTGTVIEPSSTVVLSVGYVDLTWDYETIYFAADGTGVTVTYYEQVEEEDGYTYGQPKTVDVPAAALALVSASDEEGGVDNGPGDVPVPEAEEGAASGNVLKINLAYVMSGDPGSEETLIPAGYIGNIDLYIPEGLVENGDGLVNPEMSYNFTVAEVYENAADYTLEYNEETNSLELSWKVDGEYEIITINTNAAQAYIEEGNLTVPLTVKDEYSNDPEARVELITREVESEFGFTYPEGYMISINLDGLSGNMTLVLPEAYVQINEEFASMEIVYEFNITDGEFSEGHVGDSSAVNSLNSEYVAPTGVYNLQGVKVGDSLNGLAKGLYIINGKKVLVK